MNLQGPRIITWALLYRCTFGEEFFVDLLRVADTDPRPAANISLLAFHQVDRSLISGDAGEIFAAPLGLLEAKHLDVVVRCRRHVFNPQDRNSTFEVCRARFAHLLSSAPIDTR